MTMLSAPAASTLAALAFGAATSTDTSIIARNRQAVEQSFAARTAGTRSPFELLAEDARWTIAGRSVASKTYRNREAFLREVIRPFNARMREPLKPTVRAIVAEGDTVVVLFDASGIARDGEPYRNT